MLLQREDALVAKVVDAVDDRNALQRLRGQAFLQQEAHQAELVIVEVHNLGSPADRLAGRWQGVAEKGKALGVIGPVRSRLGIHIRVRSVKEVILLQ